MLGIHGSAFGQDFIHLAESLPSTEVRAAIDAALNGKTTTTVHEVEAADVTPDAARHIEAVVRPNLSQAGAIEGAVIELSDVTQGRTRSPDPRPGAAPRSNGRPPSIAGSSERTRSSPPTSPSSRRPTRSMLQASEEAQSGREEVETLNEEFQATNEELETLNEELTASVEELRIANEDLAARTEELRLQTVALEDQKRHSEEEHDRLQSVLDEPR